MWAMLDVERVKVTVYDGLVIVGLWDIDLGARGGLGRNCAV